MSLLTFNVQGSAEEPYVVTFEKISPEKIRASCTCPAGQMQQACKHRLSLLDEADGELKAMLEGTKLAAAMQELVVAQDAADVAKARLSAVKHMVGRLMNG